MATTTIPIQQKLFAYCCVIFTTILLPLHNKVLRMSRLQTGASGPEALFYQYLIVSPLFIAFLFY